MARNNNRGVIKYNKQEVQITKKAPQDITRTVPPVQLERIRQDVLSWREAIKESEYAYFPQRVKMQQMFIDTILNGHVETVMQRRRDLTLLRAFDFFNAGSKEPNADMTEYFQKQWFFTSLGYIVDALFFGYSLIKVGDIVNDELPNIDIIKRWHISPDREVVTPFLYGIHGERWDDPKFANWHIYVKTPNETGVGYCGNGLLYKVALYEIFLRNVLAYNGDFVELYSQPYRVGKTMKNSEEERAELENALRSMGSSGYAIIDPTDEIQFLETALGGTGYKGYESLEMRCEKKISKIILGHADAVDSIPGKLGNDGEESPASVALTSIQVRDGRFVENVINGELLPRMRRLGIAIPDGNIKFRNDKEKQQARKTEDANNKVTAEIAQTMKNAGLKMDPKYFEERTGIITTEVEEPEVVAAPGKLPAKIQNKLDELYR